MRASQLKLTAIVETPLYEAIKSLARRDHTSVSQKVRELLVETLALLELMEGVELGARKKSHSLATARKRFRVK